MTERFGNRKKTCAQQIQLQRDRAHMGYNGNSGTFQPSTFFYLKIFFRHPYNPVILVCHPVDISDSCQTSEIAKFLFFFIQPIT